MIPSLILGMSLSAITMRLTRTMMLEVLRQDYIRTAWAKGLNERTIVWRHALRNALIPVVTLVGIQAPLVIGGAVIIEQIFVIPGMGMLLLEAVTQRDYPIVAGVFLVVGIAVMLINLLVDLSYGLLDPKVRYPLMTSAIVTPCPSAATPQERNACIHRAPVPREAARRCRRSHLRAVPAVRPLRGFSGAIRLQPDQPDEPTEAAVMGISVRH